MRNDENEHIVSKFRLFSVQVVCVYILFEAMKEEADLVLFKYNIFRMS